MEVLWAELVRKLPLTSGRCMDCCSSIRGPHEGAHRRTGEWMEVYGDIPLKIHFSQGIIFCPVNWMLHSKGDAKKLHITGC